MIVDLDATAYAISDALSSEPPDDHDQPQPNHRRAPNRCPILRSAGVAGIPAALCDQGPHLHLWEI